VSGRYLQDETIKIYRQRAVIAANVERIRYYDAVLTDSALLAAATGDQAYERRYRKIAPRLDQLLEATIRLVGTPEARRKIEQTRASNRTLVKMELHSLKLVHMGHRTQALNLLNGARYSREKRVYEATSSDAYRTFLASSDLKAHRVEQLRLLGLMTAALATIISVVVGGYQLRLGREHQRAAAENERSRSTEAQRVAAEREYHASQRDFTEIMQITRDENEAYGLLKRHLERTLEGSEVAVLNRNNSHDRLELTTDPPPESPLVEVLKEAEPHSCLAIRLGKPHERHGDRQALLDCAVCAMVSGMSTCVPSLVRGEVIGAVLVQHPSPLTGEDRRRVEESMAQASPVLANLRNLSLSESRALTDLLSGLPNRRSIDDTLRRMAAQASRTGTSLATVLFDLDHFKRINDVFGHEKGDEVLAAVGSVIAVTTRASDFAGRYGGEEFIILLPDTDRDAASTVAEKLRLSIAAIDVPGVSGPITASLGVAALPEDAVEPMFLLRAADRALYVAKARGRNRVELATADPVAAMEQGSSRLT
jgi:diguanylate cyclase (GGDEF)-like protein